MMKLNLRQRLKMKPISSRLLKLLPDMEAALMSHTTTLSWEVLLLLKKEGAKVQKHQL